MALSRRGSAEIAPFSAGGICKKRAVFLLPKNKVILVLIFMIFWSIMKTYPPSSPTEWGPKLKMREDTERNENQSKLLYVQLSENGNDFQTGRDEDPVVRDH